jgi:hypothetical protein
MIRDGKLRYREDRQCGAQNARKALIQMRQGQRVETRLVQGME